MDIKLELRSRLKREIERPYKGCSTICFPKNTVGKILKSPDEVCEHYRRDAEECFEHVKRVGGTVVAMEWQICVLQPHDFEEFMERFEPDDIDPPLDDEPDDDLDEVSEDEEEFTVNPEADRERQEILAAFEQLTQEERMELLDQIARQPPEPTGTD